MLWPRRGGGRDDSALIRHVGFDDVGVRPGAVVAGGDPVDMPGGRPQGTIDGDPGAGDLLQLLHWIFTTGRPSTWYWARSTSAMWARTAAVLIAGAYRCGCWATGNACSRAFAFNRFGRVTVTL